MYVTQEVVTSGLEVADRMHHNGAVLLISLNGRLEAQNRNSQVHVMHVMYIQDSYLQCMQAARLI